MAEKKNQKTVNEVASEIYITAHNAGSKPVQIMDDDLRKISDRSKLREVFKKDLNNKLESLGCSINEIPNGIIVTPPEERATISFNEAKEASVEAQKSGVRENPDGGISTDVL